MCVCECLFFVLCMCCVALCCFIMRVLFHVFVSCKFDCECVLFVVLCCCSMLFGICLFVVSCTCCFMRVSVFCVFAWCGAVLSCSGMRLLKGVCFVFCL